MLLNCKLVIAVLCIRLGVYDISCLPKAFVEILEAIIEIGNLKKFTLLRCETPVKALTLLLEGGFYNYSKIKKDHKSVLHDLFKESYGFVNVLDIVISQTRCIVDLDNGFLCSLLPLIKDIFVLNNILILGVCFGKFEIVQLAIENGAHDFLNARKAANIFKQEIILHGSRYQ